jgi:glycosyltransferase involved in cell wall biosynthesis
MIVLAVPDFEPSVGGTTTQVALLGRALARRDLDPVVVTRRRRREWARAETVERLPVLRLGPPGRSAIGEKATAGLLAAWLTSRRRRIGVVHSVMWLDAVAAAGVAGLAGRTLLTWGAAGDAADAIRGWRGGPRRALLRRVRHVGLTDAMAREVEAAGLGAADVVPIAVDRARFHPPSADERAQARASLGLDDGAFVVAYVGHLRRLKRVDLLVEAFAQLARERPEARLTIVGGSRGAPDDVEGELRDQVRRGGLSDSVSFHGVLLDPRPTYFAADVVALASEREGMPNTLVEAMACGVPCVAPASAGGEALLETVARSNAPEDLLAELERLAASPEERQRLGAAAAARAAAFDPEAIADRYATIYRELGL